VADLLRGRYEILASLAPHVARTQVDYARMFLARRQPGDADAGRQRLTSATALARQLGMSGLLADIDVISDP
jgi:hypothetical protein